MAPQSEATDGSTDGGEASECGDADPDSPATRVDVRETTGMSSPLGTQGAHAQAVVVGPATVSGPTGDMLIDAVSDDVF
jgi:hypothetical protein